MINLKTDNWTINNIDTILFDKDGTFIDLHFFWGKMTELRVEEIIKRYHLNPQIFNQVCLMLGYDSLQGKMLSDGITAMYSRQIIIRIFTEELQKIGLNITEQEIEIIFDEVSKIFYQEMTKYTKPIESAIEFIKKVKKLGVKTGIVTSDSKESTILTLNHFCWNDLFDVAIGRESTKETKESGVPVKLALEILNASAQNTIMVGDAPMDYLAAKNGGVEKTILVSTGQIAKEELQKISEYCANSLDEVSIINN